MDHMHFWCPEVRRELEPLELELQTVVVLVVFCVNLTQVSHQGKEPHPRKGLLGCSCKAFSQLVISGGGPRPWWVVPSLGCSWVL